MSACPTGMVLDHLPNPLHNLLEDAMDGAELETGQRARQHTTASDAADAGTTVPDITSQPRASSSSSANIVHVDEVFRVSGSTTSASTV